MKLWKSLGLTVILFEFAIAQCVNQPQQCNMMNEAMIEAPRSILPQPIPQYYGSQGTIVENPCSICNSINKIPTGNIFPSPTTIITDYSPAICKHLADTLQLMVVCNLLQGNRGSSELAMKLASPIIKEVLTSPTFTRAAMNTINSNTILPNIIKPPLNTNFIPTITNSLPPMQAQSPCNKDLLPNILSLLRNLK
ncbi:PREDICTED: uncharacterized protein LOC106124177 isoform X2 [Papilio xuthus]|uniref:Uncharacterized protein LOC106124177 isoform X2 n=1 Tax=Papilio xuthus TaxID=66420 RepID=A0A194PT71_PAPXU|nr:PREDICTED: uncharacterized protein LOC106124177 isoform X2 [Papilio xuthus]KPI96512.1 hypothetical protein RR46_12542 [Papilio xuthus]